MARRLPLIVITFSFYAGGRLFHAPGAPPWHQGALPTLTMSSGDNLGLSWGDVFVGATMLSVLVDLVRPRHSREDALIGIVCSGGLALLDMVCFFSAPGFGTASFLHFTLVTLIDAAVRVIVTLTANRHHDHRLRDDHED
ncbi:MAG: hypothetical protein ABW321_32490 [Polyangiales bacterium]